MITSVLGRVISEVLSRTVSLDDIEPIANKVLGLNDRIAREADLMPARAKRIQRRLRIVSMALYELADELVDLSRAEERASNPPMPRKPGAGRPRARRT